LAEFTGERVIPGHVDPDLLNEHLARYAFAARLATGRRALDAGCGAGYGASELARKAQIVFALDVSAEALAFAHDRYTDVRFLEGSCAQIPLKNASVDLVTAFEVIEHIPDWERLLSEVRRILAPGGQFVVSTPNKLYYAESRRLTGPNPYHVHEFEFEEFDQRLRALFPHVSLYLQNHIGGVAFQRLGAEAKTDVQVERGDADPAQAHFFLAVCSVEPQPAPASFIYVPSAANILRERELHIARLEQELATKDEWLENLRAEKQNLVDMFRAQTAELEESNRWARELDEKLHAAQDRIVALQDELAGTIAGWQAKAQELEEDIRAKTAWALQVKAELEAKGADLVRCIGLLDTAEQTVKERTEWAQRLDQDLRNIEQLLAQVKASRWVRLGRTVGLGPALEQG
jgi:SAM-dependent methyltransferase